MERFFGSLSGRGSDRTPHVLSDGLHICRECGSPLVEPVYSDPVGAARWALTLNCPECGWWTSGVWSDEEAERLEAVLAHARSGMRHDCEALARASFREEIARFAAALDSDVITPADF